MSMGHLNSNKIWQVIAEIEMTQSFCFKVTPPVSLSRSHAQNLFKLREPSTPIICAKGDKIGQMVAEIEMTQDPHIMYFGKKTIILKLGKIGQSFATLANPHWLANVTV